MIKLLIIEAMEQNDTILQEVIDFLSEKSGCRVLELTPTVKSGQDLNFPGLEIRWKEQSVYCNGIHVPLSHYEFFTLHYLAEHPGWVFSKQQIYEAVWKEPGESCGAAVASVISQLRRKLWTEDAKGGYIRTVHNSGYKFEV